MLISIKQPITPLVLLLKVLEELTVFVWKYAVTVTCVSVVQPDSKIWALWGACHLLQDSLFFLWLKIILYDFGYMFSVTAKINMRPARCSPNGTAWWIWIYLYFSGLRRLLIQSKFPAQFAEMQPILPRNLYRSSVPTDSHLCCLLQSCCLLLNPNIWNFCWSVLSTCCCISAAPHTPRGISLWLRVTANTSKCVSELWKYLLWYS